MRRPQGGPSALEPCVRDSLSSQWMWLLRFLWLIIEQEELVRESTVPYVFADLALVWNWPRRPPPPSFIQNSLLTSATYLLHPGACAGMQPYTCPLCRPEALVQGGVSGSGCSHTLSMFLSCQSLLYR